MVLYDQSLMTLMKGGGGGGGTLRVEGQLTFLLTGLLPTPAIRFRYNSNLWYFLVRTLVAIQVASSNSNARVRKNHDLKFENWFVDILGIFIIQLLINSALLTFCVILTCKVLIYRVHSVLNSSARSHRCYCRICRELEKPAFK